MESYTQLSNFYDAQASKYYQTRKKYWEDGDRILEQLSAYQDQKPDLLELGCGGGRLLAYLKQRYLGDYNYLGIDISSQLLALAQKEHPQHHFIQEEMNTYLASVEQESLDIIIACASFQHLQSPKERMMLMENAYRALRYGGKIIFLNWALSSRFIKKHPKVLLMSWLNYLKTFGKTSWRDVQIPWKDKDKTYHRYYHLFSLQELQQLSILSGFITKELFWLDKQGKQTEHWTKAANSRYVGEKEVFI